MKDIEINLNSTTSITVLMLVFVFMVSILSLIFIESNRKLPAKRTVVLSELTELNDSMEKISSGITLPSLWESWNKIQRIASQLNVKTIILPDEVQSVYKYSANNWYAAFKGKTSNVLNAARASQLIAPVQLGKMRTEGTQSALTFYVIGVEQ